ncbi:hypothetical protein [Thalassotalea crassostreae]|uniref:hypothetical protein n=1 Tax=Thalassotalea crassostreae TaxID=1763536 RepID=UPI0008392D11|nr:hypothetical protein [Thalassotalea crassostreae]
MKLTSLNKLAISTLLISTIAACSNTNSGNDSGALKNLPSWVTTPTSEKGLADSACVQYSGTINVDKSEAVVLASEQLAGQLERKVSFLAKSFQSKTKTTDGLNVGTNFTQSGQQLVQQTLVGTKAIKMGVYEVSDKEQLCVLVELNGDETKEFYAKMKQNSKATLDAQDDSVIYEEFRAYKADQELQKAISNN